MRFDLGKDVHLTSLDGTAKKLSDLNAEVGELASDLAETMKVLNVAEFVIGNNIADDTVKLNEAAELARTKKMGLFIPKDLTVKISSDVNLRDIQNIRAEGTINCTNGAMITAGDKTEIANAVDLYFAKITGADTSPLLRIMGVTNGNVTVMHCPFLQLYADASDDFNDDGISYSKFYLGLIDVMEIRAVNGMGWINENSFYGGRIRKKLWMGGTYAHENNVFYKLCIEGTTILEIADGNNNSFHDLRSEGTPTIIFGANTYKNFISDRFIPSPSDYLGEATVTDNGFENIYLSAYEQLIRKEEIIRIDSNKKIFAGVSGLVGSNDYIAAEDSIMKVQPGIKKLKTVNAWSYIFETGVFEVKDTKAFVFESDSNIWYPEVHVFDANMQPLTGNAPMYIDASGGWEYKDDTVRYGFWTGQSTARISFTNLAVKYANIKIRTSAANSPFEYVVLYAFTPINKLDTSINKMKRNIQSNLWGSSIPKQGIAKVGDKVESATSVYKCTFIRNDTLAVAGLSTDTVLTLAASTTSVAVNDVIGVLLDDGTTHWTTVSAKSGSTVTLATALGQTASVGNNVVINRWV